jgi:Holliday junction resolvase-like predicted endonuclease
VSVLTEDDVVEAVCQHLQASGYRIVSRCATTQRGEDIVAENAQGVTLRVEAKGETSSKSITKRFGKPFDNAQANNHVAKAFYAAAEMLGAHGGRVALALPETRLHREHAGRIRKALQQLGVGVFWVKPDRTVTLDATWSD